MGDFFYKKNLKQDIKYALVGIFIHNEWRLLLKGFYSKTSFLFFENRNSEAAYSVS